jgi:hypothetical protein
MKLRKRLLMCGLLCGVQAATAGIVGSFTVSGIITVTGNSTIAWNSNQSPFLANNFTLSAGAGFYSGENGQNVIATLTNPPATVGSTFSLTPLITFVVDPSQSALDINYIYSGTGGTAGCTAPPNTSGTQTCTLAGSPFTFTNGTDGDSTAAFVFSGVTANGLDTWIGSFNMNFQEPYQTIVASFISNPTTAMFTDTFMGTVDVTSDVTSSPEPGAFVLIGVGLVVIRASRKFRGRAQY